MAIMPGDIVKLRGNCPFISSEFSGSGGYQVLNRGSILLVVDVTTTRLFNKTIVLVDGTNKFWDTYAFNVEEELFDIISRID